MPGRWFLAAVLALAIGIAGASAEPLFRHGGQERANGGGGGGALAYGCDSGGSGVCADFANGQTFVTWPDPQTGAAGANTRFRLYRSTAPITAGNYTGATLVAKYILNNSGQLFGGNPDTGGASFNQTNRQSAAQPMSTIPDAQNGGTKTLAVYTGLQVYTAQANQNAYYAVVATDTSDANPVFLGSVGPIAESVATPQPVQYAHRTTGYGNINSTTAGLPAIFLAHASSALGGPPPGFASNGDYYEWWLTPAEGWQDGRATTLTVLKDGASGQLYPSLSGGALVVANRDTVWNPNGTGALEGNHFGLGLRPLNGTADRLYPITCNGIKRMLIDAVSRYGADANQLHWVGKSMGAWGGARCGLRSTNPQFASIRLMMPLWRFDWTLSPGSGYWGGETWGSNDPFRANPGGNASVLGTVPASVLLDDGTVWGGDGHYADTPSFVQSYTGDLAFVMWQEKKDDNFQGTPPSAGFKQQIDMAAGLEAAHRGFAFCWTMGVHADPDDAMGPIDYDYGTDTAVAYKRSLFALNLPYVAFANSSIDDNPGTGVKDAAGIYDGDPQGCINVGFTWNVSSDTTSGVSFTVGNPIWMSRAATAVPQTTLAGTIASSGTGTVALTDGSQLQPIAKGAYFVVGGSEIVRASGLAGNTLTLSGRGQLGTTAQAHAAGETIRQYIWQPTGPNGGPQTSMTADIALRRLQSYHPADGSISCTVTPFGGSATPVTGTVVNGVPILTGITINAGGDTSGSCG